MHPEPIALLGNLLPGEDLDLPAQQLTELRGDHLLHLLRRLPRSPPPARTWWTRRGRVSGRDRRRRALSQSRAWEVLLLVDHLDQTLELSEERFRADERGL
jgi:hypothetical protein